MPGFIWRLPRSKPGSCRRHMRRRISRRPSRRRGPRLTACNEWREDRPGFYEGEGRKDRMLEPMTAETERLRAQSPAEARLPAQDLAAAEGHLVLDQVPLLEPEPTLRPRPRLGEILV